MLVCVVCHHQFSPQPRIAPAAVCGCLVIVFGGISIAIAGNPSVLIPAIISGLFVILTIRFLKPSRICPSCGAAETIPIASPRARSIAPAEPERHAISEITERLRKIADQQRVGVAAEILNQQRAEVLAMLRNVPARDLPALDQILANLVAEGAITAASARTLANACAWRRP